MTNNTEKARDAGFALELLTISDPAVRASMLRYIAAVRIMITGKPLDDGDLKVLIGARFGLSDETENELLALTRGDECDRLCIVFDVDDALGPPLGIGLFHRHGGEARFHDRCRLWSPPDGGHAIVVGTHGAEGHFVFRRGAPLRHRTGVPAGDLRAGYQRAVSRLARLVASPEMLSLRSTPYVSVSNRRDDRPG